MTAVMAYLDQHPEFQVDELVDSKLTVSGLPNGFLRRMSD